MTGLNGNNALGIVSYNIGAAGSTFFGADAPASGGFALSLQAAIYGQVAKGEGKIVSKPRIAAQSGASAKIITGDALPILTSDLDLLSSGGRS